MNKPEDNTPRIQAIADIGITDSRQFANFMSALISDLSAGRVTPERGNAICNAGGKLLKVRELEYRCALDAHNNVLLKLAEPATRSK